MFFCVGVGAIHTRWQQSFYILQRYEILVFVVQVDVRYNLVIQRWIGEVDLEEAKQACFVILQLMLSQVTKYPIVLHKHFLGYVQAI